jgi:hypothetical protein
VARVVKVALGALGRAAALRVWVARCAITSGKLESGGFSSLRRRPRLHWAACEVAAGATLAIAALPRSLPVVILDQQRFEGVTQMPLDVIDHHAEEDMRAHPR